MTTKYYYKIDTPWGKKGEEFKSPVLSKADGTTIMHLICPENYPEIFEAQEDNPIPSYPDIEGVTKSYDNLSLSIESTNAEFFKELLNQSWFELSESEVNKLLAKAFKDYPKTFNPCVKHATKKLSREDETKVKPPFDHYWREEHNCD